jgi:hypothetical protein
MKKLLILFISGLFLISCEPIPGEKVQVESGSSGVKVEKLFTVDGVTVYRFHDGGETVYFTNASGTIKYETDDGDGNVITHKTICNGKIKAKNPKD